MPRIRSSSRPSRSFHSMPRYAGSASKTARLAENGILLQPAKILLWVVEPVGMIDAQAVDLALAQQAQHQLVGRQEDVEFFHAQGGQFVDVEKPSIVDFIRGHAPVRKTIDLFVEQAVEQIEAARVVRQAVEQRDRPVDRCAHAGAFQGQVCQPAFDDFFHAVAPPVWPGPSRRVPADGSRR